MKRINQLSKETISKIAAGEVVERPASVVKELVENSIDSGAKNIFVEIIEGGQKLIKVTDNGSGIHPQDIEKAFIAHATSKIEDNSDLFAISTMGFRGEALSSIAAVSKVSLTSKTDQFNYGMEINIEGGKCNFLRQCGSSNGTSVAVESLFYNIPARAKFLKSSSRESAIISDMLSRIAIYYDSISFRFNSGDKNVISTYGTGNKIDSIRSIYGKEICDNIIYFQNTVCNINISGYIGKESISRGSRNYQTIFVNGRLIKDRTIVAAAENAYKSFVTINKFPFFILFINTDLDFVDVNVHPSKNEVKFRDERIIYKSVFDSIHEALRENLKDSFNIENFNVELPVDLHNSIENIQVRENAQDIEQKSPAIVLKDKNIIESIPLVKPSNEFRIIGQFHKTYILCEQEDELYIIDQHAAHEKVMFEKFKNELINGEISSQILLNIEVLELTSVDYNIYIENAEVFKKCGFAIEPFGECSIVIREVPLILWNANIREVIFNMLNDLKNLIDVNILQLKYDKIASTACKSAVKANDYLSEQEIQSLIKSLKLLDDPYNCPHGRPTMFKLSLTEIEKRFRRIV